MFNTYCFSTPTVVTRTHLTVTFIRTLPCLDFPLTSNTMSSYCYSFASDITYVTVFAAYCSNAVLQVCIITVNSLSKEWTHGNRFAAGKGNFLFATAKIPVLCPISSCPSLHPVDAGTLSFCSKVTGTLSLTFTTILFRSYEFVGVLSFPPPPYVFISGVLKHMGRVALSSVFIVKCPAANATDAPQP
jgi:hypothetical protein